MATDVLHADGAAFAQQYAEDAVEARQLTDLACPAIREADCDELVEAALAVGNAERAVAGTHQPSSGPQYLEEDTVEIEIARDCEGGTMQLAQPPG